MFIGIPSRFSNKGGEGRENSFLKVTAENKNNAKKYKITKKYKISIKKLYINVFLSMKLCWHKTQSKVDTIFPGVRFNKTTYWLQ